MRGRDAAALASESSAAGVEAEVEAAATAPAVDDSATGCSAISGVAETVSAIVYASIGSKITVRVRREISGRSKWRTIEEPGLNGIKAEKQINLGDAGSVDGGLLDVCDVLIGLFCI